MMFKYSNRNSQNNDTRGAINRIQVVRQQQSNARYSYTLVTENTPSLTKTMIREEDEIFDEFLTLFFMRLHIIFLVTETEDFEDEILSSDQHYLWVVEA